MVRNRFQPGEALQIVQLVQVLIFAKFEAGSNADKLMLQDQMCDRRVFGAEQSLKMMSI